MSLAHMPTAPIDVEKCYACDGGRVIADQAGIACDNCGRSYASIQAVQDKVARILAAREPIDVLEVDQWTSTGDIRSIPWDLLKQRGIEGVRGGDSEAIRVISGGRFVFKSVKTHERPSIGRVWFRQGPSGLPEMYLENYDSSD